MSPKSPSKALREKEWMAKNPSPTKSESSEEADPDSEQPDVAKLNMPSSSPSSSGFKPTEPKFGGLKQTSATEHTPWTGGAPEPLWTKLKDPTPGSIRPTQYRPVTVSAAQKAQGYRTKGLTKQFSRGDDLQVFQKEVMKHLVLHGMDTICYLEDPRSSVEVVNVVEHHGLFDMKKGCAEAKRTATNEFDEYDKFEP